LAGHAAHMGEMTKAYKILVENLNRRHDAEELDVHEKIILEWILEE